MNVHTHVKSWIRSPSPEVGEAAHAHCNVMVQFRAQLQWGSKATKLSSWVTDVSHDERCKKLGAGAHAVSQAISRARHPVKKPKHSLTRHPTIPRALGSGTDSSSLASCTFFTFVEVCRRHKAQNQDWETKLQGRDSKRRRELISRSKCNAWDWFFLKEIIWKC